MEKLDLTCLLDSLMGRSPPFQKCHIAYSQNFGGATGHRIRESPTIPKLLHCHFSDFGGDDLSEKSIVR
uniref:Uncharacterized protein n=1 Tax=Megaselia scalaris TaxID=36166 RepID=T1GDM8_MEGSC